MNLKLGKNWLKIFGVLILLKGAVFLFFAYKGMSGFAIYDSLDGELKSVLGLTLIIFGFLFLIFSRKKF